MKRMVHLQVNQQFLKHIYTSTVLKNIVNYFFQNISISIPINIGKTPFPCTRNDQNNQIL